MKVYISATLRSFFGRITEYDAKSTTVRKILKELTDEYPDAKKGLYDADGKERVFSTYNQEEFKDYVLDALKNKPENGFVWIPVYNPSRGSYGSIQYVFSKDVVLDVAINEWKKFLNKYSPENGSQMASVTIYFLLLLRWLKDGIITLEQICYESDGETLEVTENREFGGLCEFFGDICKIVENTGSSVGYAEIGGSSLEYYSLSDLNFTNTPNVFAGIPLACLSGQANKSI